MRFVFNTHLFSCRVLFTRPQKECVRIFIICQPFILQIGMLNQRQLWFFLVFGGRPWPRKLFCKLIAWTTFFVCRIQFSGALRGKYQELSYTHSSPSSPLIHTGKLEPRCTNLHFPFEFLWNYYLAALNLLAIHNTRKAYENIFIFSHFCGLFFSILLSLSYAEYPYQARGWKLYSLLSCLLTSVRLFVRMCKASTHTRTAAKPANY